MSNQIHFGKTKHDKKTSNYNIVLRLAKQKMEEGNDAEESITLTFEIIENEHGKRFIKKYLADENLHEEFKNKLKEDLNVNL